MKTILDTMSFKSRAYWVLIFFSVTSVVFAQADVDPNPLTNQCLIQLIDPADKEPLVGAHICVELADGRRVYEVSDTEGKVKLLYSGEKVGTVAISSIGYVTTYMQLNEIEDGAIIPVKADVFNINQVVVTGTSEPTPVDSSIYKVKVIGEEKIRQSGSVNLAEILLTEANIRIESDMMLGSQIEMLGMSGSNVKVMIDGVPVVGRLNGNIDLSQINMSNVKQIEVIEGPMSVIYGSNALAGTINIITKKNNYHDVSAQVDAFVESVGRYSGNGSVSKRLGNSSVNLDGGYEYFSGVDYDESSRLMDWRPKKIYRGNANYQYQTDHLSFGGKVGYYSDQLFVQSDILDAKYNVSDSYYYTDRLDFAANLAHKWGNSSIDVVAGYNLYERSSDGYSMSLTDLEKTWREKVISQEASQFMTRAIYSTALIPGKLSLQSGVDISSETFEGPRVVDQKQQLGDYALFLNMNFAITPSFEVQPGIRFAYNTKYDAPVVYSLNTKWNIRSDLSWRASFARGFRAPELKELFYEFIDSNHEIYGNSDLEAESSYNVNTSFDYKLQHDIHNWRFNVAAYYNTVDNLIALASVADSDGWQYYNISEYQSTGTNIDVNYGFKNNLQLRLGYGLTGRQSSVSEESGYDEFNFSHDLFAGLKWKERKSSVTLAIDYKYTGEIQDFQLSGDVITEVRQEAYQIMNASASKSFFKNKLQTTLGVKNILDVTSVNRTNYVGGAHSGGSGTPISYGRSFFINLIYKFNKL
ncbi:TonB-dependent receptor [Carboxylicivirga sp. A043]|uniref:TonB-dependent receptor plug domain-containing protein n=1 Tax=Carboxylicivirga litoralis TaxID=2816963 RepID=UPI0021CAF49B|nr:TonB-dependent receptor [Carboxylicivirga sp. A043]MCU4155531.1 TonB-dependent receptor [Carboxylicivirga sp. A043]